MYYDIAFDTLLEGKYYSFSRKIFKTIYKLHELPVKLKCFFKK